MTNRGASRFSSLLDFAHGLADLSGTIIRPYFRKPLAVANKGEKGAFDPVTKADRAAERAIRRAIKERWPDHGLVGEELGSAGEDRRFRWEHFLTAMHAKGGFDQGGLHNLWGVVVDLVCLGMFLWVFTGIVMWWTLPFARIWGWLAILSGTASFAWFLSRL